ncbi:MAG: hypothetical protein JXR34_09365 [Bacteroidales bacterium]|nr:hypothetical protein [Bacteroidales bacterium]
MQQLILKIKDSSKLSFLLQLINQLDFVELENVNMRKEQSNHDLFKSAGLWANRDIDAKTLRQKSWNREK